MRFPILIVLALVAAGCGKEIGDECIVSSDCSPNGDRLCIDPQTRGGYCTIMGCDWATCPEEAVCVRFFTGSFENRPCESSEECTLDELCALTNRCVPRNSEIRYCMKTCDSDKDCRDGYQCRDLTRMRENGGEPVLAPGVPIDERSPKFCAIAPA